MYFTDYRSVEAPEVRGVFEEAWGVALPPVEGLTTIEIADAVGRGDLRAMFIMGENPLMSDPDLNAAREHFNHIDFLAVQDIFMTETAEIADVVLPAASWAEKGRHVHQHRSGGCSGCGPSWTRRAKRGRTGPSWRTSRGAWATTWGCLRRRRSSTRSRG